MSKKSQRKWSKKHPEFVQVIERPTLERLVERNIYTSEQPSRLAALTLAIQSERTAFTETDVTRTILEKAEAFYQYMEDGTIPPKAEPPDPGSLAS